MIAINFTQVAVTKFLGKLKKVDKIMKSNKSFSAYVYEKTIVNIEQKKKIISIANILFLILHFLIISHSIWAQGVDDITQAILKLPNYISENKLIIAGQIYGGEISAVITDNDNNVWNFKDGDVLDFRITSVRGDKSMTFTGTKPKFDLFIKHNVNMLLQLFFPTSVSEGISGKDASQNHCQLFFINRVLLNEAFKQNIVEKRIRRSQIGGLIEYEGFETDHLSGKAVQGIFYIDPYKLAIQSRYTLMHDNLRTKSISMCLDLYPHYTINRTSSQVKIGFNGFMSFLNSWSTTIDLGSLDFGGGIWSSYRKDYSRFRLGVGSVLQVSRTYLPPSLVSKGMKFFVDAINRRKFDCNITYGIICGYLLTDQLSLNTKIIENHSFMRTPGQDMTSQTIMLISFSYLFRELVPIDIGYKMSVRLEKVKSKSIFLQGNYRW